MSRSGMLKLSFPYLLFLLMGLGVYWSNVRASHADAHYRLGRDTAAGDDTPQSTKTKRWIDPVCQMDVNPAWGFTHEHEGEVYYFCARRCVEEFAAAPESFLTARCLVCKQALEADNRFPATYLDNTYYLCSAAHRDEFKADPAGFFMHRMWGIPDWLYYISIGLVLVVSFLMFEGSTLLRRSTRQSQTATEMASRSHTTTTPHDRAKHGSLSTRVPIAAVATGPPAAAGVLSLPILGGAGQPISARTAHPDSALHRSSDRIDLMQLWVVRTLLRSRPFRFAVQLFVVALFLLIIAAGLFGNQNPGLNIAPILTWTIWWAGLVVLIMFAGKAWCYMCPWDAVAGWMERFALWWKTEEGAGLSLKWPRIIRNITIATIMFVGLTWVELGFGVTMSPSATAYIAIAMLLMAIVSAFLFDRKSFCRYGCLVGRVSGLYALFSAVEIRHRDANTCLRCRTHDCYKGSEKAYGCPTFENPGTMSTNTYCIQCAECLQACPHDNLAVNLRPWGEDLKSASRPR
ncbi:MAG: YHS domain-containing protein, partial [Phycisphaerae bacterium]